MTNWIHERPLFRDPPLAPDPNDRFRPINALWAGHERVLWAAGAGGLAGAALRQQRDALDEHGAGLSLPEDAGSPEEVVPAELRHRLWAQFCLEPLWGIGQEGQTLADAEGRQRIEELVDRLREHHLCLNLTVESDPTLRGG